MRKSDSGIIGSATRDSTQMKAENATPASTKPPTTVGLPKPTSGPSTSAQTSAPTAIAPSTAPYTSRCRCRSCVRHVSRETSVKTTVTTASGMLRRKITRQDTVSTMAPPTTGPATVATLVHAVHEPIALPASSPYVARSNARLPGVSNAPNTPWIARAAISTSLVGAMPASTEATAKPATPMTNVLA